MAKAFVNGVECTIYGYGVVDGLPYCKVKYPAFSHLFIIPMDFIEVRYNG